MSYLYVIRSPSGLRKVGHSTSPKRRCGELRCHNTIGERGTFTVEYQRECFGSVVAAEINAHGTLAEQRVRLEYFATDFETARAAVDAAIEAANTGIDRPTPPNIEQTPIEEPEYPPRSQRTIRLEMRLPQEKLKKLDSLRRLEPDLPSRAKMLYLLIKRMPM